MNKELIQQKINELGYVETSNILDMDVETLIELMGSDIKTFKDLEFEETEFFDNGVRSKMFFTNGYAISVIRTKYSYGGPSGLYEIAVLDSDGDITYGTDITNDVIGYLKPDEVSEYMVKIQEL